MAYNIYYNIDNNQATGIGGVGGGIFGIPPLAENFSKIPPPWKFWSFPLPDNNCHLCGHYCFYSSGQQILQ